MGYIFEELIRRFNEETNESLENTILQERLLV